MPPLSQISPRGASVFFFYPQTPFSLVCFSSFQCFALHPVLTRGVLMHWPPYKCHTVIHAHLTGVPTERLWHALWPCSCQAFFCTPLCSAPQAPGLPLEVFLANVASFTLVSPAVPSPYSCDPFSALIGFPKQVGSKSESPMMAKCRFFI